MHEASFAHNLRKETEHWVYCSSYNLLVPFTFSRKVGNVNLRGKTVTGKTLSVQLSLKGEGTSTILVQRRFSGHYWHVKFDARILCMPRGERPFFADSQSHI